MESDWPRKRLDLWVFSKNEARDKRNWEKKDAARECLKPEESTKTRQPDNQSFTFKPKTPASAFEDPAIGNPKDQEPGNWI
jgi:hypothetical protein